jgi:DNA polymerase-3 subunit gamma/tau
VGSVDVEAIRRMWPDVLTRVYQQRRATWTFVSEHAQVMEYDGRRLRLAISTDGLLQTFRRGPHAELVRQALIDVLGVDAQVEGVRLDGAAPAPAAPAAPPEVAPDDRAAAAARSWDEPPPEPEPAEARSAPAADPAPEPSTPRGRAAAAPTVESAPDDGPDEPSMDDLDLDGAAMVGQPVVEQLLGGRVIDDR